MGSDTVMAIYALAVSIVARMPGHASEQAFRLIADATWWRRGNRICQLEKDLISVLGQGTSTKTLRSVSHANVRSQFRYLRESALLADIDVSQIPQPNEFLGEDLIETRIRAGRGIVIALPHMANWEYAGAYLSTVFGPVTSVAARFGPDSLYQSYLRTRHKLGIVILPLTSSSDGTVKSGSAEIFASLAQRLRQGGMVCLLADRVVTGVGVEVPLFGKKVKLPAGPASLALHTGAALLPATLWYEEKGWSAQVFDEIRPPVDGGRRGKMNEMTRMMGRVFEGAIRDHVEDWHMPHTFFL